MRAIAVAVAFFTAGCANDFSHGAGFPISSERAVQIASDELRRRGIAISPRWRVDVTHDVVITEAVGDIPTWLVTFHAPRGKFGFPRYRVSAVQIWWWSLRSLLIQLPSVDSETSNQAMQLTAGRSDTSRMVNRTCNLQPRSVSPAVADLVSR